MNFPPEDGRRAPDAGHPGPKTGSSKITYGVLTLSPKIRRKMEEYPVESAGSFFLERQAKLFGQSMGAAQIEIGVKIGHGVQCPFDLHVFGEKVLLSHHENFV